VPLESQQHAEYMQRALALARSTIGLASPNPSVGCVLVRDGAIVGEGAHLYDARDHAEIVALRHAGTDARGATAYVTLEPCSHHGRTGPCADALIAAEVRRVVVATLDPNPQVSGEGIRKLRAANIEVIVGPCEQEARQLNDAFAHFIRTGRPFVTLKAALSSDGMLAPTERIKREPHWLTGPEARAEVHRMRHAADAILVGIGTVLADDPHLTDRSTLPRRRPLLRVVLDSQLRIPRESHLARSANSDLLILHAPEASPTRIASLNAAGVETAPIACIKGRLDLNEILNLLGQRQILSLLLECGSQLNGAFLTQHLAPKLALFKSPISLGPHAIPFASGIDLLTIERQLQSRTHTPFGTDTLLTGYLQDPWSKLAL
jgi:diaminohydroxyphosphoribosylaminopyrimidine deaminase/5-amino-6-(5-phosphoribosylamino)uracil reductase